MLKKFEEANIERCEHRSGGPAVKVNGSFPKRLISLDNMNDIFITYKSSSGDFKICQISEEDKGYYILYILNAKAVKDISIVIRPIAEDGNKQLHRYMASFIDRSITYTNMNK